MKLFLKTLLLSLALATSIFANEGVVGFWKQINEDTNKPESIIAIYPYQGKYYGRIIGTFNDDGVIDDTIYAPQDKAPGVQGDPYYAGLDLMWDLKQNGSKYTDGKIMDPEKGRVYNAEMWTEDGKLIVRGKLLMFGRNQTWLPAEDSDYPKDFKKPDLTKFTPEIRKVK